MRSDLRSTLEYMWALLSSWMVALVDKIPSPRVRRAIAQWMTVAVILIIVLCGVLIVYILVVVPPSTTVVTTYP